MATKTTFAFFLAVAAFASPAFAQDGGITLRVDSGSVMASTGGEYETANTGKALVAGEKVMINAGSSASALYPNGCSVSFTTPGVYEVPATCNNKVAAWDGHVSGKNASVIAGTALIGAALLNSMETTPAGPISTGQR